MGLNICKAKTYVRAVFYIMSFVKTSLTKTIRGRMVG